VITGSIGAVSVRYTIGHDGEIEYTPPIFRAQGDIDESHRALYVDPAGPAHSSTAGPLDRRTCAESYLTVALTVSPQSGTSFPFSRMQHVFGAEPTSANKDGYMGRLLRHDTRCEP